MEVPYHSYQSVHSYEQNHDKSRLPSFKHLLLTSGNFDELDAQHSSLSASPGSTPHLIEDCSNRSSSEDTTRDLHRSHSPYQHYKLTSLFTVNKSARHALGTAKDIPHTGGRPYRVVKDSRRHNSLLLPRALTPKSRTLRSILKHVHQGQGDSDHTAGASHSTSTETTVHSKRRTSERAHVAWQHSIGNDPLPDRAWSHVAPCDSSTISPSASNMKEHFYGITSSPTKAIVKDTCAVTLLQTRQQQPRKNLFRPSQYIHLPPNEQQHDGMLTSEVDAPFSRDKDPAVLSPKLTRYYLDIFFNYQKHTPFPMFAMLPRDGFIRWAVRCQTYRSLPDRLMIYALMLYATSLEHSHVAGTRSLDHQAEFKVIVYQEIEMLKSKSSSVLQNVHTLLFLTLVEFSNRQTREGADMFHVCVDVLTTVLKRDIEQGLTLGELEKTKPKIYDFSAPIEAECRRCTFWTVFTFGTHMGLDTSSLQSINRFGGMATDLLRKKHHQSCEWLLQQPRSEPDTAMLGISMTTQEPPVKMPSDMTHDHMIELTRIYADVGTHVSRSGSMRLSSRSCPGHERRRRHLHGKLRTWADTYNDALVSREHHGTNGSGGPSMLIVRPHVRAERTGGLHMIYYLCQMQLSRRVHHDNLSNSEVSSHARHATVHAIAVLRLAEEVMSSRGPSMRDYQFISGSFSSACAILEAIDVVTAVGRVADILEPCSRIRSLLYSGLDLLAHVGSSWGHGFVKYDMVKRRVQTVFRGAEAALGVQKTFFCCSNSMVDTFDADGMGFDMEFDLTYGPDRKHYIRLAFPDCGGSGSSDCQDVFEIDTRGESDALS